MTKVMEATLDTKVTTITEISMTAIGAPVNMVDIITSMKMNIDIGLVINTMMETTALVTDTAKTTGGNMNMKALDIEMATNNRGAH